MLGTLFRELRRSMAARDPARHAAVAARPDSDAGSAKKTALYRPDIFEVSDIEAAMRIILTAEAGTTTEERWARETPFLAGRIGDALGLDEHAMVIDYGCGIGRVAKELIARYRCHVLGVDISGGMRALAPQYVQSECFAVCAPEMLGRLIAHGFRATHAYACWVIQHCARPAEDLNRIASALPDGAGFFVLNSNGRWVPTDAGWSTDGISVEHLLRERFDVVSKQDLPEAVTTPELARSSFMMTLRTRPRSG